MVKITLDLGSPIRALKEWQESREFHRQMKIARLEMESALLTTRIFMSENDLNKYGIELDAIRVDIFTSTTREHCKEVMERIKRLRKMTWT